MREKNDQFIDYPQKYEEIFSYKAKGKTRFSFDHIGIEDIEGISSLEEYTDLMRKTFIEAEEALFEHIVRVHWLYSKFTYKGQSRGLKNHKGIVSQMAFGTFMRMKVQYESRLYSTGMPIARIIVNYLDDFFPDFSTRNPFKEKFEYPYKYMRFGELALVNKMDERLDLLRVCEEKKIMGVYFQDYVLNWLCCHNETLPQDKYIFCFPTGVMPYVKNLKNTEGYNFGADQKYLSRYKKKIDS
jgi:hypothetical protein